MFEIYQGWKAHAKWADTLKIKEEILKRMSKT